MADFLGSALTANGIRETWWDLGDGQVAVEYSHDAQDALDLVAAVNSEGAQTIDGLGRPVGEIDQVLLMNWAKIRGIPWEKLAFSNEYHDEFQRFFQEHSRLQYRAAKTVHSVL